MIYTTTTYKGTEVPRDVKHDILNLIDLSVELEQDEYRENYKNYNFESQKFITVQYDNEGYLRLFSSVYNREFYGTNTYRILNRLMRHPKKRLGGSKTNRGEQPSHEMLEQQIVAVENIGADFYFISRQKNNVRWLNYYIEQFNDTYSRNLIVSKDRYWICPDNQEDTCAQLLIYPKSKTVPFDIV